MSYKNGLSLSHYSLISSILMLILTDSRLDKLFCQTDDREDHFKKHSDVIWYQITFACFTWFPNWLPDVIHLIWSLLSFSSLLFVHQFSLILCKVPPTISQETPADVMVRENLNVTLKCIAKGYPKPFIKWRREDNRPIEYGNWQEKKTQGIDPREYHIMTTCFAPCSERMLILMMIVEMGQHDDHQKI